MDLEPSDLLARLRALEREFEEKVDAQRVAFRYRVQNGRAVFEKGVIAEHKRLRKGLLSFLRDSTFGGLMISPFVYFLIVPFVILDLSVSLFQRICFSVWGIARVPRREFIVLDRQHLAYLNGIEKLNCVYCGYANGVIAYVREVAGRTEQYWCPIKHAIRRRSAHPRYHQFADYGDSEGFRARLEKFREDVRNSNDRDRA